MGTCSLWARYLAFAGVAACAGGRDVDVEALERENKQLRQELEAEKAKHAVPTSTDAVHHVDCPQSWTKVELQGAEWVCRAEQPSNPEFPESCNLAVGPAASGPVSKQLEVALSKAGRTEIKQVEVLPVQMGGVPGSRLVYDYMQDGLAVRTFVSTVVHDGLRYVLTCASSREGYETHGLPFFEAIERSFSLRSKDQVAK